MKLYSRVIGSGVPFIILHGLYGSSDNWFTHGKELSNDFEVHLVDQRNHGKSPHSDIHDYNSMADDLYEYFTDKKIEKAVVLGHSMGGKVAMLFAQRFPELVDSLIVVDVSPFAYSNTDDIRLSFHKTIFDSLLECDSVIIKSREEADDLLKRKLKDKRLRMFLLKNLRRDSQSNKYYWQLNIKTLYSNLYKIMEGVDIDNNSCNVKTLFIKAANSIYLSKQDFGDIQKLFPNSNFHEIKHAGHWVHAEQPLEFMRVLKEFVL